MRKKNSKFTFWLTLSLFLTPFIAASWLYAHADQFHFKTKNKGILITPPAQVANLETPVQNFHHHWWVLIFNNAPCETTCQEQLHWLHQIHIALHKHQTRVQLWMAQSALNPDMETQILKSIPELTLIPLTTLPSFLDNEPGIAIMDPLGNIMMRYPFNTDPQNVFKDLKTLLHNSQIG